MSNVNCTTCKHSIFEELFGEYKCKKNLRTCTESEVIMGCNQYEKPGSNRNDEKPEYIVRSGATFTPNVSPQGVLSWTNDKGLPNPAPVLLSAGLDGKDGKDGLDGKDGYTPVKGVDYFDGKDGKDGKDGTDGYTPVKGVDYFDGKDGRDGTDGKDGYTPVKGVDYHTPEEKQDFIDEVVKELMTRQTPPKIGIVTLLADKWNGENSVYSQVVNVEGVTENSQVDLTPSVEQLAVFYEKDLTFVTENQGGVVTVYAIGQKPMNDYTIQVTITEVDI